MGKSYIENSLKRFLKRKVKITLGLVVTFLITGAVAFAEETAEKPVEEMNNFEKAEHYLQLLGKSKIKQGEYKDNTGKYTITVTENGNISFKGFDITGDGKEDTIPEIENKMISKVTKELLENGALSGELVVTDKSSKTNTKILTGKNGQSSSGVKGTFINEGIIITDNFGQYYWGGKLYNYGIIISGAHGDNGAQKISSEKNNLIENTGIIIATNKNGIAQYINAGAKESNIYNYGYIQSKGSGQVLANGDKNTAFNYGIINSTNGNAQEINFERGEVTNSEIINYGLIEANKFAQSVTGATNTAYNYGIIKGENSSLIEVKEGAKAYNEGIEL